MKILKYIFHDCFVWENDSIILVFDFWKDPTKGKDEFPKFISEAKPDKKLYVFVSHHHKDHFSKKIFLWEKKFSDLKFIISKDTFRISRHLIEPNSLYNGYKPSPENVIILSHGEKYQDENIMTEAFESTDIGNSYIVRIKDEIIFHAGDLNAWIWKDESTAEEVLAEEKKFTSIIEKIALSYPRINLAMFPVDSRIGTDYFTGASIFVRKINIGHFVPMHFALGESEEEMKKFERDAIDISLYANKERGEYVCLTTPYASFGYQ